MSNEQFTPALNTAAEQPHAQGSLDQPALSTPAPPAAAQGDGAELPAKEESAAVGGVTGAPITEDNIPEHWEIRRAGTYDTTAYRMRKSNDNLAHVHKLVSLPDGTLRWLGMFGDSPELWNPENGVGDCCVSSDITGPVADPPETQVPAGRVEHLTTLLSEALELFGAGSLAEGEAEWIWSQQASAAVSNTCVKCSAPCDGEGDCVSPECCFGRAKLAQVNAAKAGKAVGS